MQGKKGAAPIYLGIFAKDQQLAQKASSQLCEKVLQKLIQKFPEDKEIQADLLNFQKNFKSPQSYHITSFFAGGKPSKEIYYTQFEENLEIDIKVEAVAYVPGNIFTGVCFPDQSKIQIKNQCPHMTLLVGKWAPKYSNDVLQSLFIDSSNGVEPPLKNHYSTLQTKEQENLQEQNQEKQQFSIIEKLENLQVMPKNKSTVYLVKDQEISLLLQGITKAHCN